MKRLAYRFLSQRVGWLIVFLVTSQAAWAQTTMQVALAGFAYAGAADTITARFPYSQRYEEAQKAQGAPIGPALFQKLRSASPSYLQIVPQIDELKGRDQALAVALVIGTETVSIEQFGKLYKLMVLIRGQTMFFDFKSMSVVRTYPISFAYVDTLDHAPSPTEIDERVRLVYQGANDKSGLLDRFVNNVSKAEIPTQVPRFLQITSVQLKPEVLDALPSSLKSTPGAAETWAADLVGEAISTRAEVPLVPYAKGYAIGNVMSMRISDGAVWELKLPKPDYEISVDFSNFRKIKYSEIQGGATSYVYGAYAQIRIEDPFSRKVYLNTALKNGETRVIPASQTYVDDFPHFYDAINGLFVKLALVISGKGDEKWIRSAAAAKDIDSQISSTKELIKLCR